MLHVKGITSEISQGNNLSISIKSFFVTIFFFFSFRITLRAQGLLAQCSSFSLPSPSILTCIIGVPTRLIQENDYHYADHQLVFRCTISFLGLKLLAAVLNLYRLNELLRLIEGKKCRRTYFRLHLVLSMNNHLFLGVFSDMSNLSAIFAYCCRKQNRSLLKKIVINLLLFLNIS